MSNTPKYTNWPEVVALIQRAAEQDKESELLNMLLTQDERDTLVARVNIFHELLRGEMSQRQVSQMLGVGIATITRGSNELKRVDDETKAWLVDLLKK
ncbi:trp operon repressor [Veronia pacifica]|uniref:Trp operon repressor homolog n=1 Tax=Veronia pacifica TaxID=1080227 RepID=A0A1C3EK66_9GAMM|nr:trp operon repressor [Veronia pacifica]ODA33626.1 Trp operon repressor [Veronia pacifica]